ncbi:MULTISPECIES: DUF3558 domain-containing protein [Streptomyces]|uniref:DUF3558 domain-containing protein n=1 Tax=Streptomyces TaxID=1883 RepID=UPI001317BFA5|nr:MULTISPECIES: DUF3558 domain-containing protein [Streptomyces]QGZ49531.1 DUF3558 domain-containing protein [Streptomyces sp. QHH-9511]GGU08754.1 hypothetical protein GCM10010272_62290 [Streptomyces lateritius]
MQRQAYVPGLTALATALALGLTGCSAGTGTDTAAIDSKAGPAAPAAAPGRYRTLFEPCRSVPQPTLRDLLPGAAQLPDEERDRAYRGSAAVTYDTDRRVGCSWKADSPDASHRLLVDIERVVSFDGSVSDDDRAQEVFARKQVAAELPAPPRTAAPTTPATPSTSGTPTRPSGSATPSNPATATATATGTGAAGTPDTAATGLEPRVLEGLGQVAFLDDVLASPGTSGRHRTVSVVFRTSNVIVTVEYAEQTNGSAEAPDSRELQEKALNLARLFAERLEE